MVSGLCQTAMIVSANGIKEQLPRTRESGTIQRSQKRSWVLVNMDRRSNSILAADKMSSPKSRYLIRSSRTLAIEILSRDKLDGRFFRGPESPREASLDE